MRNTEQILKSVGLLAYEIGSLQECNEELSKYGPENFKADRITVKVKPGQQTAPGRNNISFASCSGQLYIHSNKILFLSCLKPLSKQGLAFSFPHLCTHQLPMADRATLPK